MRAVLPFDSIRITRPKATLLVVELLQGGEPVMVQLAETRVIGSRDKITITGVYGVYDPKAVVPTL